MESVQENASFETIPVCIEWDAFVQSEKRDSERRNEAARRHEIRDWNAEYKQDEIFSRQREASRRNRNWKFKHTTGKGDVHGHGVTPPGCIYKTVLKTTKRQ